MHLFVGLGRQGLSKKIQDKNAIYNPTTLRVIRRVGMRRIKNEYENITFKDGHVFSLTNIIRLFLLRLWSIIHDLREDEPSETVSNIDDNFLPARFDTKTLTITFHIVPDENVAREKELQYLVRMIVSQREGILNPVIFSINPPRPHLKTALHIEARTAAESSLERGIVLKDLNFMCTEFLRILENGIRQNQQTLTITMQLRSHPLQSLDETDEPPSEETPSEETTSSGFSLSQQSSSDASPIKRRRIL